MASPLTENDLTKINDSLTQLKTAKEQIRLAEQAGVDVSHFSDTINEQEARLLKIKQTYFPGR